MAGILSAAGISLLREEISEALNRIAEDSEFEKTLVCIFLHSKRKFAEEVKNERITNLQRSYYLVKKNEVDKDNPDITETFLAFDHMYNLCVIAYNRQVGSASTEPCTTGLSDLEKVFTMLSVRDFKSDIRYGKLPNRVVDEIHKRVAALFFTIRATIKRATCTGDKDDRNTLTDSEYNLIDDITDAVVDVIQVQHYPSYKNAFIALSLLVAYLAVEEDNASRISNDVPEGEGAATLPNVPSTDGASASSAVHAAVGATTLPEVPSTDGASAFLTVPGASAFPNVPVVDGASASSAVPAEVLATDLPKVSAVDGTSASFAVPTEVVASTLPRVPAVDGASVSPTVPAAVRATALPEVSVGGKTVYEKFSDEVKLVPPSSSKEGVDLTYQESRPFYFDLYVYIAYRYSLIAEKDYKNMQSRTVTSHFTENIGKSVILLSYAYKNRFSEYMAGVFGYLKENLEKHNAKFFISKFVEDSFRKFPDSSYRYLVLLCFISEVTLLIYKEVNDCDPYNGYINKTFKYYLECGMGEYEDILEVIDDFKSLNEHANRIAKAWSRMGLTALTTQKMKYATKEQIVKHRFALENLLEQKESGSGAQHTCESCVKAEQEQRSDVNAAGRSKSKGRESKSGGKQEGAVGEKKVEPEKVKDERQSGKPKQNDKKSKKKQKGRR